MLTYLRKGVLRRYLRLNAIRRGLFGGSKPWLAVLVLGLLGRQVGKVTKRGEMPVVLSERLEQGEALLITHLAPERRGRGRRRAG
jgi:hypothetical protein